MSTRTLSIAIAAVLLAAGLAPVQAQIVSGLANGPHHGPFIEPDTFRPDFQFFAPADATDYTPHQDANRGFYFDYSRLYVNVSRPDSVQSHFEGDFTWGNRIEMGFITDDEAGWGLVGWHIDGPNEERNFVNDEGDIITRFDGTTLELTQTLNKANLSSVELNRIFQRQYFHAGGVLEPFFGLRYVKFEDFYVATGEYLLFDTDLDGNLDTDLLFRGRGRVENNMLGAQIGCRIFKEVGHWALNTELRAFVMQNWQFVNAIDNSSFTTDANAVVLINPNFIDFNDQATVFGGELKMDASYKVTRDISLSFGFVLMDLGKGVGRAGSQTPTINNNQLPIQLDQPNVRVDQQDLFIGGLTFGFEVNR